MPGVEHLRRKPPHFQTPVPSARGAEYPYQGQLSWAGSWSGQAGTAQHGVAQVFLSAVVRRPHRKIRPPSWNWVQGLDIGVEVPHVSVWRLFNVYIPIYPQGSEIARFVPGFTGRPVEADVLFNLDFVSVVGFLKIASLHRYVIVTEGLDDFEPWLGISDVEDEQKSAEWFAVCWVAQRPAVFLPCAY